MPSYGTLNARTKPEPVTVWQSEQWQANSVIGSAMILYRAEPQMQPPWEFFNLFIVRLIFQYGRAEKQQQPDALREFKSVLGVGSSAVLD